MVEHKYIQYIPSPLLRDITKGCCVPFIGSGFSLNADIPDNEKMLMWGDLGEEFRKEVPGLKTQSPLEAISVFEFKYKRPALAEKMKEVLLTGKCKPGACHSAFCKLPFNVVCTTNFDCLLEDAYNLIDKNVKVVVDETQLAIASDSKTVEVIKLHGDINRPMTMIATEEDYDSYLDTHKLMATFLGNLLITRTPLFIGYSLDDVDFRQIYQVVKTRLGTMKRNAYVIKVNANEVEIEQYKRRGVTVINIPGETKDYKQILTQVFLEIQNFVNHSRVIDLPEGSTIASELKKPDRQNDVCFFMATNAQLAEYKEDLFRALRDKGFEPLAMTELNGRNFYADVAALTYRCSFVFVDLESDIILPDDFNMGFDKNHTIFLCTNMQINLSQAHGYKTIHKHYDEYGNLDIGQLLTDILSDIENKRNLSLYKKLLKDGYYQQAMVEAFKLLKLALVKKLDVSPEEPRSSMQLFKIANDRRILKDVDMKKISNIIRLRNSSVHTDFEISKEEAEDSIMYIEEILSQIENDVVN